MDILEYNDVDPLQVLNLSMLALNFPFTPENAAHIRRTDPRPFPCLTIHAVEDGSVLGQVGVFRLPMISVLGREDVGGIWAMSTYPQYAGRGAASTLLEEAHGRMRDAGLRFSTLSTNRYCSTHNKLYRQHGYVDMNVWATALARWEFAHQPTRLRARPASQEGFDFIEKIFKDLANEYLGFTWRHTPFARLRDKVNVDDIWTIWADRTPVGFVFTSREDLLLKISIQALRMDIDALEAVAAVVSNLKASYVRVMMSRPTDITSFRRAGWQTTYPTWDAFMVKPLLAELTVDEARRLFGVGTDRFLISWLDTT
jgi:GNAT superfamily N-acetyltransferase